MHWAECSCQKQLDKEPMEVGAHHFLSPAGFGTHLGASTIQGKTVVLKLLLGVISLFTD